MTFSWSGVCSSPPHSSLGFASSQWVPEITHHCPRTPFLLVGTQVDLRDDSNTLEKLAKNKQRALTCESGEKLARELKAVKYVECSALTQVRREEEEVPCFIGRSKDTWAASTQEIMTLLWNKLADNSDFRGLFYTSRCGCDYSVISHVWFAQCCDKQEVDSSFSLLIWKKDSEKWLRLLELAQNVWGVNAQTQSM